MRTKVSTSFMTGYETGAVRHYCLRALLVSLLVDTDSPHHDGTQQMSEEHQCGHILVCGVLELCQ